MLLLSPTAALKANGTRISGSGSFSVNGHGTGSARGASGKNKSSAERKSLGGRSASPVASTTSSGPRTAAHISASASSSAGPSNSTIPPKRKQPPSIRFAASAGTQTTMDGLSDAMAANAAGWEWDDANVVHLLPALVKGKGVFPPAQLASHKLQMANILCSLDTTFTTCACGEVVGASASASSSSSASACSADLGEGLGGEEVGMDRNGLGARGCAVY
ncbi:hypothetical protein BT96DRAFT_1063200 [Gymnopus androsaceus JB14]|uniref:Uncharacterized protein n=1 Tax=Gymnopus androsaceus JB14 TaxID=1447944 RepID=A0A6A4GZK8_9AGAR|nr:hypothetical protein BT96DRAFT_1063200 [Gymnopus androsaceus JB14]